MNSEAEQRTTQDTAGRTMNPQTEPRTNPSPGRTDPHRPAGSSVLLAGAGHLGFPLGMLLGRTPRIQVLRIVDRGRVGQRHVQSEGFPPSAVGQNKAEALAQVLREAGTHLQIETFAMDLEDVPHGVFDVDACVAGLDSLRARQVLINDRAWPLGVPVIDGGLGDGTLGRVTVYSPSGACPECGWGPQDYQQLATEYPCLPGTDYSPPSTQSPPYVAAVVAGLMSAELDRLLDSDGIEASHECLCELPSRFLHSRLRRASSCRFDHAVVASRWQLPVPLPCATVGDVLQTVADQVADQPVQLEFRRGLLAGAEIFGGSGHVVPGMLNPLRSTRLAELGLQAQDLVRVRTQCPDQHAWIAFREETS